MKRFFRSNGFMLLLIALLLTALLAVGSYIMGGDPIADALSVITTPFRNLSAAMAGWVEDSYDRGFRYDALVEVNEELKRRVTELEALERDYQEAVRQNEMYKDLLGLAQKHAKFDLAEARITQRTTSSWERTATLDKGAKQGIEEHDCVVDQYYNLVGVVTTVDYNSSVMTYLTDAELELGGRVVRTDENAILEGDFTLMLDNRLKFSYLPEGAQLIAGDQIITSGLGEVYPPGLVVGTIESMHTEANGLDRYAVVKPEADLESQRYVFIIRDFDVTE